MQVLLRACAGVRVRAPRAVAVRLRPPLRHPCSMRWRAFGCTATCPRSQLQRWVEHANTHMHDFDDDGALWAGLVFAACEEEKLAAEPCVCGQFYPTGRGTSRSWTRRPPRSSSCAARRGRWTPHSRAPAPRHALLPHALLLKAGVAAPDSTTPTQPGRARPTPLPSRPPPQRAHPDCMWFSTAARWGSVITRPHLIWLVPQL